MPKLARRLFTLCSAASLVLCVAAVGGWIRSHDTVDKAWLRRVTPHPTFAKRIDSFYLVSGKGALRVYRLELLQNHRSTGAGHGWGPFRPIPTNGDRFFDVGFNVLDAHHSFLGISYVAGRGPFNTHRTTGWGRVVAIPYRLVVLATAVVPTRWFRGRFRRRGRRRGGLCVRCGYDLRASRGRCPECGTLADLKVSA